MSCLCKHCRSRSVGFFRSQLIWICTVYHEVCEFLSTIWIKWSDWLKIRNGCGIIIYSAGQGLRNQVIHAVSCCSVRNQGRLKWRRKTRSLLSAVTCYIVRKEVFFAVSCCIVRNKVLSAIPYCIFKTQVFSAVSDYIELYCKKGGSLCSILLYCKKQGARLSIC